MDDNRDAAESLAMLLEMQGHTVAMVHASGDAIEKAASFRPDIIVLDLGLPGIDGYDVARQIRAAPGGKSIGLVALTGWDGTRIASAPPPPDSTRTWSSRLTMMP